MNQTENKNEEEEFLYFSRLDFPAFSDLSFSDQLHRVSVARSERLSYKASEEAKKKKPRKKKETTGKKNSSSSSKISKASKALSNLSEEQIKKLKSQLGV